jgi:hypothetical protein
MEKLVEIDPMVDGGSQASANGLPLKITGAYVIKG